MRQLYRIVIVALSCVFCLVAIADDECPIGYGPTKYVTTKNLFDFS